MNATKMYNELKSQYSINDIAARLHLHVGTLKRWETLQKIPQNYLYDLNFLLGNKYDLPKENFRSHNEFFTKKEIAKYCLNVFLDFLKQQNLDSKNYTFIEPSCGNCSFYNIMPLPKIGIDLEYKSSDILQQNFLDFKPDSNKKYITLGNPPFGLRGNLALRFINHAATFSDFVAFILPPLFNSDGKGNPKSRVRNLTLVHSEKLPINSFIYPNQKEVSVATIFQIWAKTALIESKILNITIPRKKTCKNYIKVYSLSDGGTPASTRNKKNAR